MNVKVQHFKQDVHLPINVRGIGHLILGQFYEFLKDGSIFIRHSVVGDG